MTITIAAVYEGGVLRPERPLGLPDHARVQVTIETGDTPSASPTPSDLGVTLHALRQRIVESGVPLLDWDGIADEVATRRGGWREGE